MSANVQCLMFTMFHSTSCAFIASFRPHVILLTADNEGGELSARPSSPYSRGGAGAGVSGLRSVLRIQRAGSWLGGGRDLHFEQQQSRPRSAHAWKAGLTLRPKSGAASRVMRYRCLIYSPQLYGNYTCAHAQYCLNRYEFNRCW